MIKEQLQSITQQGEDYRTEFKRSVNSDLPKELVAFANGSGGNIYIGIDDDGSVRGVKVTNEL